MPFIKNNLFLIALVAVVLILCGGGLAFYFSYDSDVTDKITQRERLADSIKSLGARPVNAGTLKTQQAYVDGVKTEYQKVVAQSQEINRRGRAMMTVEPNGDKPIAIFPVDKQAYSRHSVEMLFVPKYQREMAKLLDMLHPVKPPSQAEITYAVTQVTTIMAEEQAANGAGGTPSQPSLLLPAGVDPPAPPQYPAIAPSPDTMLNGITVRPATTGMPTFQPQPPPSYMNPSGTTMGATEEVQRRAMNNLKHQKAGTPGIFATDDSLYVRFLPPGGRAPLDEMWMALISWWLQQDLVAAILETNQTAGGAGTQPAIPTIAEARIKRLVKVELYPYVGATLMPATLGVPTPMPGVGPGGPLQPLEEGLTKRVCNTEYDVVTYTVQLVMKSSEVAVFQRNLQKRNFYTVLSVGMTAVATGDSNGALMNQAAPSGGMNSGVSTGGTPSTEPPAPEQNYYYGPDPVMMVTLKIEAIFFTNWERDLMPVEMLGKLQIGWRPEDSARHAKEAAPLTGSIQ